jgi:exodeoxyribonuclease III
MYAASSQQLRLSPLLLQGLASSGYSLFMKIASWNINSVRARIDIVERFLTEMAPDILCLQETKAENGVFPAKAFRDLGYAHIALNGQKMHHGVAIVSKVPLVEDRKYDWQDNGEARHIGVRLPNGVLLENVYIPAGGDIPDRALNSKFGQKLDFLGRMTQWGKTLNEPTIITGDFNIAPLEHDVWGHKQLVGVVSHTPIEIETLAAFQASHDWVDLARHFIPEPEKLYTWWSYRSPDWETSDRGRRLDHMWASPAIAAKAKAHVVHKDCRNWGKPSDHIPIVTDFDF